MLLNVLRLGPVSQGLTIEEAITNLNESTVTSVKKKHKNFIKNYKENFITKNINVR